MPNPNFIILYVADPIVSATFYASLLEREAIELSPSFALFALESGVMLGLWAKHTVAPAALAMGGGTEIAFAVENNDQVAAMFRRWQDHNIIIAQTPTQMDFGYTFVGLDVDGHRLRVFAPSAS